MIKTKKATKTSQNKTKIHTLPGNHKFSTEFIRATIYLYHMFHELDKSPLIAWFEDFDKEPFPEKTLETWLRMADTYQLLKQEEPKNIEKHKKIYKLLVILSTGITLEEVLTPQNDTGLGEKDIVEIYNTFNSIKE